MKIKFGKTTSGFANLPKVMLSIHLRPEPYLSRFWRFGQLYRGYWGLYAFYGYFHINFWYHHWEVGGKPRKERWSK